MWQKYTHLSLEERQIIYSLRIEGFSHAHIAKELHRSTSTITREIHRNSTRIRYSHATNPRYHYLPDSAQHAHKNRRKHANSRIPLKNEIVKDFVFSKLQIWWSPDIISGVLKKIYKWCTKYTISHESIYRFIYSKEWEKFHLKQFLRRKHKTRRKYTGRKSQKIPKIPNPTSIHERKHLFPQSETRQEFGHFEGDSILSVRTTYSSLRTEVERKTRFVFIQKIPQKTAQNTEIATLKIFQKLPIPFAKSTTWDNGTEHANHEKITEKIGIKIFFADPYKSHQRGTNERINGMIREFFPKGTNFDEISDTEIQKVQDIINNRPRRILGYRSSQEVFDEEIRKLEKLQKRTNFSVISGEASFS